MENYKECPDCGGKMVLKYGGQISLCGRNVVLEGVNGYVCEECGCVMFSEEETKKIYQLCRGLKRS